MRRKRGREREINGGSTRARWRERRNREREMKERTYRCTGAAYAPTGRASSETYRGAGAFDNRFYRGGDLRLARELHGCSDRETNQAIDRWRRDRRSSRLRLSNNLACDIVQFHKLRKCKSLHAGGKGAILFNKIIINISQRKASYNWHSLLNSAID